MNWIQKIVASIGLDKIAHFSVSGLLVFMFDKFLPFLVASILVLTLSVAKEAVDEKFEWKDLLADILGILVAILIIVI